MSFCSQTESFDATHVLQEEVELRVAAGIDGHLEQRQEDVLQHLLEVAQLLLCAVNVTADKHTAHHTHGETP